MYLRFQPDVYLVSSADVHLDVYLMPPRFRPKLPPWRLSFSRLLLVVGDAVMVSVPLPNARENGAS